MAREDNLTPFTKDDDRASQAGKKSSKLGSKHLSNLIKNVLDDIDWEKTNLKDKESIKKKYGNNGWKAIVYVATTKAMGGDMKAMSWLADNGFGKKFDITTDDEPINKVIVEWAKPIEPDKDSNTD